MRAAIYYGAGRIVVEDVPDPVCGLGELVVRMLACGLCGSDLMQWYQDPRAPVVLGHEPIGQVVQVGDGADFAMGERVFVHHHVPCFECNLCHRGRHTLCDMFRKTAIDPGGLSELIRVPALNVAADVLRIPSAMDDVTATLIEPVACIIRGQHSAGVVPGSRVVVVGCGSMGLLEIQVAMALGAWILGERIESSAIAASALVLVGVALVLWPGRRSSSTTAPTPATDATVGIEPRPVQ